VIAVQACVLVVDDEPISGRLLARSCEREGHRVELVEDGRQALRRLAAGDVDAVLLDVVMPELDGFSVLAAMARDRRLQHIPVIMVSGVDEVDSVVRCIELGAADYLQKPFDPVILRARLNTCLARKRLHDLELDYIEQVGRVIAAAQALEQGGFDPSSLDAVAGRDDALGGLARVFQTMAGEVQAREQALRREVQQMRIVIDGQQTARQVAEITESDYFQELQRKAGDLRTTRP
jgi:two-component system, cell cycle response regulator